MKCQLTILAALCLLPAALATISAYTGNVNGFTLTSGTSNVAAGNFIARFTGLTTNLVQGTDYTYAVSGTTITLTNMASGNYTFSDDNAATFYVGASNGALTNCLSPDLPAITLDTANSLTYMGPTRLRLRLRFLENNRYQTISYRHKGGEVNCNSSISSAVDATYQVWTRTSGTATCGTPYMQLEYDFNWALTYCSYYRDETDPNNTIFNGTIIITTVDTGVVIRGARYARSLDTAVTIKIAFQTNVSASNGAVSVFGPRITYSAITQQLWNPATLTATLTLFTSVQWPYQLATPANTVVAGVPTDWSTYSIAASPQDGSTDTNSVAWTNRAKCYSSSGATSTGATAQTTNTVCNQYWTIVLVRSTPCGSSVTLAGSFTVGWNVTCPSLFTGSCSAPNPLSDSISFTTNSTNYCPQLITNNNLNSASLATYSNNGYTTAQTQFVFGTTTYFEATVTSPILMSNVAVEYVYVTAGGTNGAAAYYTRAFTTPGPYFAGGTTTVWGGASVSACSLTTYNTAAGMTVLDNADGASNALSKKVRFAILWNACSSAATGDAPQSTTVQVNVRIRYTNQTTVSLPTTLSIKATQPHLLAEDTPSISSSANVGITTDSASSATAASSDSSMTVIAVIAAIVVATALVVVVAVVVIKRQRAPKENPQMSSVNLSSTSSTTA